MIAFSDTNLTTSTWPYASQQSIYYGTSVTTELRFWVPPPPPAPRFPKMPERLDRRLGELTLLEELQAEARVRRRPPPRAARARPVKLVTLERWPSRLKSFKR